MIIMLILFQKFADNIGAPYIEISAKKNINLEKLFGLATHLALNRELERNPIVEKKKIPKKKKCNIM